MPRSLMPTPVLRPSQKRCGAIPQCLNFAPTQRSRYSTNLALRIRTTPITENTFTGMAVGAAGSGYRPVVIGAGHVRFRCNGPDCQPGLQNPLYVRRPAEIPITFRAAVGGGTKLAAQHSQSPYSMFMNLAGLKVILPSTPYDMKGLLKAAIRDDNPVMSFESNR